MAVQADEQSSPDTTFTVSSPRPATATASSSNCPNQRAGCIADTVWIAGRHVTYLGRKGETHVE